MDISVRRYDTIVGKVEFAVETGYPLLSADINFCNIVGLDKTYTERSSEILLENLITQESYQLFCDAVNKAYDDKDGHFGVSVSLENKEGSDIVVYVIGTVYPDRGMATASAIDITMMSSGLDFNSTIYSRTEYEFILNNIECPVMLCDYKLMSRVIYANRSFYEMIGCTAEEVNQVYDRVIGNFMYEGDRDKFKTEADIGIEDDMFTIEFRVLPKSGKLMWVILKGQRIVLNDSREVILCTFYNIDRLKDAERRLDTSTFRISSLVDMSKDVIFELDLTADEIVFYNYDYRGKAPGTRLKCTVNELRNENIIHPEDLAEILKIKFKKNITEAVNLSFRKMNNKGFYEKSDISLRALFDKRDVPVMIIGKEYSDRGKSAGIIDPFMLDDKEMLKSVECRRIVNNIIDSWRDKNNIIHEMILLSINNYNVLKEIYSESSMNELETRIVKAMKCKLRGSDIVSKFSDNMYIIFTYAVNEYEAANSLPQRLLESVEEVNTFNEDLKLEVSAGVSMWPDNAVNYDGLFEKALTALNSLRRSDKTGVKFYKEIQSEKETDGTYVKDINESNIQKYVADNIKKSSDKIFAINPDYNVAMYNFLMETGLYYNFDRIKIISINEDNNVEIMYSWCRHGIKDNTENYLNYVRESLKTSNEEYRLFAVNDVLAINEKAVNTLGVSAILQNPIVSGGKLSGFVACEIYNGIHIWSNVEKTVIKTISDLAAFNIFENRIRHSVSKDIPDVNNYLSDERIPAYEVDHKTHNIVSCNREFKKIYGEDAIGSKCYKMITGRNYPCKNCVLDAELKNGERVVENYDSKREIWTSMRAVKNGSEEKESYFISIIDVTGFVNRIMSRDSLTGLDTVPVFKQKVKNVLSKMTSSSYCIASVDFDKFKDINQTIGYELADELIMDYADMMLEQLASANGMICRVSADKFLALFTYADKDNILNVVKEKGSDVTSRLKQKYTKVQISITVGIYLIKPSDYDVNSMIDRANIASKTVKNLRQSSYAIYNDDMEKRTLKEKEIENKMYKAIENHEFVVFYQPKTDLKTEKIVGAEALVRWKEPDGRLVPPLDFIPLFERNGFIVDLDYYVFEEVFIFLRGLIDKGENPVPVSLNVSRAHMYEPDFVERLMAMVNRYNISTSLIELELTEGTFLSDQYMILRLLNRLKEYGFKISIDDFGSGFSSLNMLKDLPIDVLKLDKEFFPKGDMDDRVKTIFVNVVKMTRELNIVSLTEGVETKEQADFLREVGCELAQGYYYSRPLPQEEFVEYMMKNK